jgi:hypothetical protein
MAKTPTAPTIICVVCGFQKKPIGRDAPAAAGNSLCNFECPGYYMEPLPYYLWPAEELDAEA